MCTYNGAQYLQRQFESFSSQTFPVFELVVCDDGSTDNTVNLLAGFAEKANFPVRIFVNERNLGSTRNFEKVIGLCEGDLIALSDQDDEWYPDKLAEFHRLFEAFPNALAAFGNADLFDEHSALTGRDLWSRVHFSPVDKSPYLDTGILSVFLRLNHVATGATMVFRTRLRDEFTPIPNSWMHDGWIAWIAALQGGLAVLPKSKMRYRIHSQQQVGLGQSSFAKRLEFARRNAIAGYSSLIEQLQHIRRYLEEQESNGRSTGLIAKVDAKICHLQHRALLPSSSLQRTWWILRSWREYWLYARGPISMLKDMLFTSISPSSGE